MTFQDPYASLNPRWRVDRIIADPITAFGLAASRRDIRPQTSCARRRATPIPVCCWTRFPTLR
jgi:ABC-type dipeptide/oligopeptide/nickel transport system ATPase subunit